MQFGKPKKRSAKPEAVERGIYRIPGSDCYYERPMVGGKRTWRTLGTTNLVDARAEYHRRRVSQQTGRESAYRPGVVTIGDVLRGYKGAGCPDKQRRERPEGTKALESGNAGQLLKFFEQEPVEDLTLAKLDAYCDWRRTQMKKGFPGYRTVDMEISTLNNAMVWALRREMIRFNPVADRRQKYSRESEVAHCREFMPDDAEELHQIAREFFKERLKEVCGWQVLIEAYTGLRTHEALMLRMDAKKGEPGWVSEDGKVLHVYRGKGQREVNPYVIIHPGLKVALEQHKAWHRRRYPDSPWYFPAARGRKGSKPNRKDTLSHAMNLRSNRTKVKRTSHGLRAFYVTVRRSWGISDAQIAVEIGHTSGGQTLTKSYGGVPTNWMTGDGPKMEWLPKGMPAWEVLEKARAA